MNNLQFGSRDFIAKKVGAISVTKGLYTGTFPLES